MSLVFNTMISVPKQNKMFQRTTLRTILFCYFKKGFIRLPMICTRAILFYGNSLFMFRMGKHEFYSGEITVLKRVLCISPEKSRAEYENICYTFKCSKMQIK
jgi:hypothetical protein